MYGIRIAEKEFMRFLLRDASGRRDFTVRFCDDPCPGPLRVFENIYCDISGSEPLDPDDNPKILRAMKHMDGLHGMKLPKTLCYRGETFAVIRNKKVFDGWNWHRTVTICSDIEAGTCLGRTVSPSKTLVDIGKALGRNVSVYAA